MSNRFSTVNTLVYEADDSQASRCVAKLQDDLKKELSSDL